MPKQYEHDVSDSVARLKDALGIEGGTFSGGPIEHFRKGWAKHIWRGDKAHYWTRTSLLEVQSRCGIVITAEWTGPDGRRHPRLHGPGNFPRCKRCERAMRGSA